MKLPTYEQQNEWIRAYVVPLFDLNFAKVARNYRLRQDKPLTDERMAQIREDVLAEAREELDFAERAGEPLTEYTYDETYSGNRDKVRVVERRAYRGGRVKLAPLKMEITTRDHSIAERVRAAYELINSGLFDLTRINNLYAGPLGSSKYWGKPPVGGSDITTPGIR